MKISEIIERLQHCMAIGGDADIQTLTDHRDGWTIRLGNSGDADEDPEWDVQPTPIDQIPDPVVQMAVKQTAESLRRSFGISDMIRAGAAVEVSANAMFRIPIHVHPDMPRDVIGIVGANGSAAVVKIKPEEPKR